MVPDLRLVRYFVTVGEEGNVTRAAERLHIAQPSLSAALKQLEQQLGVTLLERSGRGIALTPAGELLLVRGRELLDQARAVADEVRGRGGAAAARLRLGLSPTARYEVGPALLGACATAAPAAMLYTREDTTGALLQDVANGRLDLAVTFCAATAPAGVELLPLVDAPAIAHVPAGHRLAGRSTVTLDDLSEETILVAASRDSGGFSDRVLGAFAAAGIRPATRVDPYPDLGLQAVREGLGVVIYVRGAFPPEVAGSAFVPLDPPLTLPFHLAWRDGSRTAAVDAVIEVARGLAA
ncbi:transcriptional regulator LysR family [Patulibacter medicamentivorans]|uniref:Transcriptional regulator LysR family n=1 Tax=Patulibacter medicamentivorans TaxID=1097667 RepID=H0E7Z7_9ACTN|nr:LysR family transcriptional regulator [Patulibacter medicamentivorans]EHN10195.1 transcriptional regulator LysR family [Patulibacter medicamentivorans]